MIPTSSSAPTQVKTQPRAESWCATLCLQLRLLIYGEQKRKQELSSSKLERQSSENSVGKIKKCCGSCQTVSLLWWIRRICFYRTRDLCTFLHVFPGFCDDLLKTRVGPSKNVKKTQKKWKKREKHEMWKFAFFRVFFHFFYNKGLWPPVNSQ